MSQRIRGQEATVQIIVDGDLKGGSFAKVTNFNLNPRADLPETGFLGEIEDDIDIQIHGWDFDFETEQIDKKIADLRALIVDRERQRLPHPDINIVVTFKYRSLTEIPGVIVLEHCVVKPPGESVGGRKDYLKNKIEGKCKTCPQLL